MNTKIKYFSLGFDTVIILVELLMHIELPPKRRTLKQSNWDLSDLQIQLGRRY